MKWNLALISLARLARGFGLLYLFTLSRKMHIHPIFETPLFPFYFTIRESMVHLLLVLVNKLVERNGTSIMHIKKNTLEFENPPFFLPINHISCVLLACWSWVLWHFGCGTSIACIPKKHTKYNVVLENPFPPSINHSSYCLLVGWAAFGNWWHLRIDLS